jgi:hypothetical protein
VNRKLLVVVIVAAVLALVVGAAVGRNLISSDSTTAPRADVVRFKDEVSKVSIAYPGSWKLLPVPTGEPDVALRIGLDNTAVMQMRSSEVGFEGVTTKTLHIVRKFTDSLLADDPRVRLAKAPDAVDLGGVPGYRYRYTFGSGTDSGAHDHYFLFKDKRMIQLVFETASQDRLTALEPGFQRIAATFQTEDA